MTHSVQNETHPLQKPKALIIRKRHRTILISVIESDRKVVSTVTVNTVTENHIIIVITVI